ncbi:trehalose-phosphatase [Candidatus Thiosymbion oneisti]|uniref:trehalose-phosphatase n=1 Tax=Candidatus Thiosymbion oneisti TaxID=589554 RepID=UPI000ABF76F8|nr:trehalose-phosphatase [Candidatus Thiosymbion oneisti]
MRVPELTVLREKIDAAIFNLDGVVTQIAKLQASAWKRLFDTYLRERSSQQGEDYRYFDSALDYRRYIDGRPRYQAIKHFLLARHIDLPKGEPDDPPERDTICGLGNRKNLIFDQIVEEEGVAVYGCTIALVRRLRKAGIKTAVVSASKHCDLVLERVGITGLFDTRIDGLEAERLDLDSKPDPDIFLEAVRRLDVAPAKTVVFEDTVVGITAGKRGRIALVIGVDHGGWDRKMQQHGADLVVRDLCRVDVEGTDSDRRSSPRPLTDVSWVSKQLAGKRPALFLDYGGTLAPIDDRPEDARLTEDMRLILRSVARVAQVVVVSGRDLDEVSELVGLQEITYAGNHGLEIRGPDLRLELPEGIDALDDLDQATVDLTTALKTIPEARLTRKRFAIVVHYRQQTGEGSDAVESAVRQVQAHFPRLHLTGGKAVIELLPDIDWDKGRAVRWLLSELGLEGAEVLPIYMGDDVTDEDAFRAVRGRGLGILVSDRPQSSAALYRVRDTDHVAELLRHLAETQPPLGG